MSFYLNKLEASQMLFFMYKDLLSLCNKVTSLKEFQFSAFSLSETGRVLLSLSLSDIEDIERWNYNVLSFIVFNL